MFCYCIEELSTFLTRGDNQNPNYKAQGQLLSIIFVLHSYEDHIIMHFTKQDIACNRGKISCIILLDNRCNVHTNLMLKISVLMSPRGALD